MKFLFVRIPMIGRSLLLGTSGFLGPEYVNVLVCVLYADLSVDFSPLRRKLLGSGRADSFGPNTEDSNCRVVRTSHAHCVSCFTALSRRVGRGINTPLELLLLPPTWWSPSGLLNTTSTQTANETLLRVVVYHHQFSHRMWSLRLVLSGRAWTCTWAASRRAPAPPVPGCRWTPALPFVHHRYPALALITS